MKANSLLAWLSAENRELVCAYVCVYVCACAVRMNRKASLSVWNIKYTKHNKWILKLKPKTSSRIKECRTTVSNSSAHNFLLWFRFSVSIIICHRFNAYFWFHFRKSTYLQISIFNRLSLGNWNFKFEKKKQ